MPFKRRFKDKYAGSWPERICCPNSVRLVVHEMNASISFREGGRRGGRNLKSDHDSDRRARVAERGDVGIFGIGVQNALRGRTANEEQRAGLRGGQIVTVSSLSGRTQ